MTVGYWMERPVEELSREELIEALMIMAEYENQRRRESAERDEFTADCMRALALRRTR